MKIGAVEATAAPAAKIPTATVEVVAPIVATMIVAVNVAMKIVDTIEVIETTAVVVGTIGAIETSVPMTVANVTMAMRARADMGVAGRIVIVTQPAVGMTAVRQAMIANDTTVSLSVRRLGPEMPPPVHLAMAASLHHVPMPENNSAHPKSRPVLRDVLSHRCV
jgi:hypothetical protein